MMPVPLRPKFCPNCATALLEDSHGAQEMGTTSSDEPNYPEIGWDCFCDACHWSGDIYPDTKMGETPTSTVQDDRGQTGRDAMMIQSENWATKILKAKEAREAGRILRIGKPKLFNAWRRTS